MSIFRNTFKPRPVTTTARPVWPRTKVSTTPSTTTPPSPKPQPKKNCCVRPR